MAKKTSAKNPARDHAAPIDLTNEQVAAARAGRGTHELPERQASGYGSKRRRGSGPARRKA
jgi:hypothetical protein